MRKVFAIAVGLFMVTTGSAMAQSAPGMTTMWVNVDMDKSACLRKAADAVLEAGFGRNHETVGNTVFGERGRYTAAARCVVDHNLMFIAVAGPDSNDTSKFATEIQTSFNK